ncbi:MAG TPA: TaqI-like C-terminal specificity domain-containing protein, partial [Spirochaetota bacterium]|nr:TaqI-like C-terminal specificity domain-containing protein [Spirochaetota bacterium]
DDYVKDRFHDISAGGLDDGGWSLADEASQKILDKIKAVGVPLGEYVKGKIYYGIKTGYNEAFVIDGTTRQRLIAEDPKSAELIKPFLVGKDIKRYSINDAGRYLLLIPKGWTREKMSGVREGWRWLESNYPAIAKHLEPHEKAGMKRYDKGEQWWELRACDYYSEFEKPKIIYPDISQSPNFALDNEGKYYSVNTTYFIADDNKYLLGLLNSNLLYYVSKHMFSTYRGGYLRYFGQYLNPLPIRTIDFNDPADKALHDTMVSLVETMLELHKKLAATTLGHDKTALQRQIDATDRQIDALVYELYGLTEEEIKIVEGKD